MKKPLAWYTVFAINTGLGALQALAQSSDLSDEQKADIAGAILAVQKVESDFAKS